MIRRWLLLLDALHRHDLTFFLVVTMWIIVLTLYGL